MYSLRCFLLAAVLLVSADFLRAQNDLSGALVVLTPTGRTVRGLPEMTALPDTSTRYRALVQLAQTTFIRDYLNLYFSAQHFLFNAGKRAEIE